MGRAGWITSPRTVSNLEQRRMGHAEAESRMRVCIPSPGNVVGPKTHRNARGVSLVDTAGSQRVRVIVVESLGSRHRTNVSDGRLSGGVSQDTTSREVPSLKETGTW
jgi:hypothetical protein